MKIAHAFNPMSMVMKSKMFYLEMGIVMMRLTVMSVVMMAGTVVGLASIQSFALNVNVT